MVFYGEGIRIIASWPKSFCGDSAGILRGFCSAGGCCAPVTEGVVTVADLPPCAVLRVVSMGLQQARARRTRRPRPPVVSLRTTPPSVPACSLKHTAAVPLVAHRHVQPLAHGQSEVLVGDRCTCTEGCGDGPLRCKRPAPLRRCSLQDGHRARARVQATLPLLQTACQHCTGQLLLAFHPFSLHGITA